MSWSELIGEPRARDLRDILCRAAAIAHAANGERHEPEQLGDNPLTYGLCTSNSARHIAARFVEESDLVGVSIGERGQVWWLEIEREQRATLRLYLYKAPPGAHTVHSLRFDDSEIKKELSTSNGTQLELFNRSGRAGSAELENIVVVHYGDPVNGLQKLDVGAPYLTDKGEIAWDWSERFDEPEERGGQPPADSTPPLGDDGKGFPGLALVPETPAEEDEARRPTAGPTAPAATSEFEALGLRDDPDQEEGAAGGAAPETS